MHTTPKPTLLVAAATVAICLMGCTGTQTTQAAPYPTYDPFVQANGEPVGSVGASSQSSQVRSGPTPTLAPLSVTVPMRPEGAPLVTPTPDPPRSLPTPRQEGAEYDVQPGDTLGAIAQSFGVSVGSLLDANGLSEGDILALGTTLSIPPPELGNTGPSYKVIPDSELVYGPAAAEFDIASFISAQGGYLSTYSEEIDTRVLSGSEIVNLVSTNYSVNPRLLLAILEHQSRWVTEQAPNRTNPDFPLGFVHPNRVGLYRQLAWAANELNRGFYLWRAGAVGTWVLNDGTVVPIDPTINAGTAAVQDFFSILDDRAVVGAGHDCLRAVPDLLLHVRQSV